MMRLLKVELNRFRSRRINQLAVLGIIAVALVMVFGAWQSTRPPSAAEMADAKASFDIAVVDWEQNGEQYIEDCLADEARDQETNSEADWGCDGMVAPEFENWFYQQPTFAETASSVLPSIGLLLVFAAFAMGVSFIAAEFSSGSIGNWLTFEPRRGRVYGTKVGASGISVVPIAIVATAVALAGVWLANSINDNIGSMTSEIWGDVGMSAVRVLLVTVAFAMLGVAMGTIVRHTAAAIGILVGYFIVVEGIIGSFSESLRPWLLNLNLQAVLNDGAEYWTTVCEDSPTGQMCQGIENTVSLGQGATVIGSLVVVVIVVAALVFRRRDVN